MYRPTSTSRFVYSALLNQSEGQGFNTAKRFSPDGRLQNTSQSITQIVSYHRTFERNMFLNVRASYKFSSSGSAAYDDFDDPRYSISVLRMRLRDCISVVRRIRETDLKSSSLLYPAILPWQMNTVSELKTGMQFRWNEFYNKLTTIGWVRPRKSGSAGRCRAPPERCRVRLFSMPICRPCVIFRCSVW